MSRVFITGSADGLGQVAARKLVDGGHKVYVHGRNEQRASEALAGAPGASGAVTGDLSSLKETQALGDQVNAAGHFDAIIHNAGVYSDRERVLTGDGLMRIFQVNVLAPYLLTALIERPARLVYLTSGMQRSGNPDLEDPQWEHRAWSGSQAYSDSKLYVLMLALAAARLWPTVCSNAVDPGWVPTRMGGAGAPEDLEEGAAGEDGIRGDEGILVHLAAQPAVGAVATAQAQ
jgi:NAD(P)-dependent dehydrogenase (short-subunit alcohol dehydrogenase family)